MRGKLIEPLPFEAWPNIQNRAPRLHCAVLCGAGHQNMTLTVKVVP